jgi:hypothetical protein
MKETLSRVRRERKASRDELRKILANTSYFTPDELSRALGPGLPKADDLRRVVRFGRFSPEPAKPEFP